LARYLLKYAIGQRVGRRFSGETMDQLKTWKVLLVGTVAWLGVTGSAKALEVLPKPAKPFKGTIDVSRDKSVPDWPEGPKARSKAPNVVLIMLDDVGFSAATTFGGVAQTPTLEKLAADGLKYNAFHVTALCSPSRAALLTGRNHHQVGHGRVADDAGGYPGYNSVWNKDTVSVAEVLRQNGYSTAAFGKWHNTPTWEISPVGPFDRWPTSLGFEYFYGFLAGFDNQYEPRLYRDTTPVEVTKTPEQGYHLTTDLADDSIRWLHQHDAVAPEKPFFLYLAPSATHWPHHAPQEWIAQYKGKFDQGWDKLRDENFARQKQLGVIPADAALTPRPPELPAWDSLSAGQKQLLSREAEVAAATLAHTDHEIGRVLDAIRIEGQEENTLVFYIVGDNGAAIAGDLEGWGILGVDGKPVSLDERIRRADELGSTRHSNLYSGGWAWAENSPFQYGKGMAAYLGGARNPLVVSWPARIKDKGGLRTQFSHLNDIAPTLFEVAGITFPDEVNGVSQKPLEGVSLAYSFDDAKASTRHRRQYFEMVGQRAIYQDGWWAGSRFQRAGGFWNTLPLGFHDWELYNLDQDYSQSRNVASEHPQKVKALEALFDEEARRNMVFPLAPYSKGRPSPADGKTSFTYRDGVARVPSWVLPDLTTRSHTVTADFDLPTTTAEGVIVADGGRWGGFVLYVKKGFLVYEANAFGIQAAKVVSSSALPVGRNHAVVEIVFDAPRPPQGPVGSLGSGPGSVSLVVNGQPAVAGHLANLVFNYNEALDIGQDLGSAVGFDYRVPFAFGGKVEKVNIELR
jgi:arylsulfatase